MTQMLPVTHIRPWNRTENCFSDIFLEGKVKWSECSRRQEGSAPGQSMYRSFIYFILINVSQNIFNHCHKLIIRLMISHFLLFYLVQRPNIWEKTCWSRRLHILKISSPVQCNIKVLWNIRIFVLFHLSCDIFWMKKARIVCIFLNWKFASLGFVWNLLVVVVVFF